MYHCQIHGWSSYLYSCPLCYAYGTTTSENSGRPMTANQYEEHLEERVKELIIENGELRKEIQRLKDKPTFY